MGIDGRQSVSIRGPEEILEELENNYLILQDTTEECKLIADHFFGKEHIEVRHRSERYLVCTFHYRNRPIFQYFKEMLTKYPMCWIKNEYSTEDGDCGIWIGRYQNGELEIQEVEWQELTMEEVSFVSDFSK